MLSRALITAAVLFLIVPPPAGAQSRSYYLSGLPEVSEFGSSTGPVEMDGQVYARSVVLRADRRPEMFFREYNLKRRCSRLTFTGGVPDDSQAGLVMEVTILGDGSPLSELSLRLGQTSRRTVSVRRVLRLRLEAVNASPEGVAELGPLPAAVLGNAKVRCRSLMP